MTIYCGFWLRGARIDSVIEEDEDGNQEIRSTVIPPAHAQQVVVTVGFADERREEG